LENGERTAMQARQRTRTHQLGAAALGIQQ
jgi:hypothetical protein